MDKIENLKQLDAVIQEHPKTGLYGLGLNLEILLDYFAWKQIKPQYILVDQYTVCPSNYSDNPLKRASLPRSSFSETDMMLPSVYREIPVCRLDCLHEPDLYILSLQAFSEELLTEICMKIYSPYQLKKEYFITENNIINDLQLMKNTLRRSLQATVYDFHFEFHLVEHCNLNCIGCTHFSPLAEPEFLSVEEFERDIKRLSELTHKTARFIHLLGGEPLLHPDVNAFLRIARSYFPDTKIAVVSNGLLVPQMPTAFWETCREQNIVLAVTEYPIHFDYAAVRKKAANEQVLFESFSGDAERYEMWKLSIDETGSGRPIDHFMKCQRSNACIFCSHGRIYPCPTMASIRHFNRFFHTNLELTEWDSLDIHQATDVNEILQFLSHPVPFCRYCKVDKRSYGLLWAKSKCEKSEWV